MKNLIITIGIVIFIVTISGMQLYCNGMLHSRQDLKFAADEAAATAALCLNRSDYANGSITFDKAEAERCAEEIAGLNLKKDKFKLEISYLSGNRPAVVVTIRQGVLKAHSRYEYVPY